MSHIPPPPESVPLLFEQGSIVEAKEKVDQSIILNALVSKVFYYRFSSTALWINFFLKNLAWCFGYNMHIGVLNLSLNESKKMFLASSHIGIVYNIEQNEQKLLEGHVRTYIY
jgi:hypothetical protein